MPAILICLIIGLPWLGALLLWTIGDARPRLQNTLAVIFSVAAGLAALALVPLTSSQVVIHLPAGGIFGDFTFLADGLGVFLAAVATVIGSLAVIFSVDYMQGRSPAGPLLCPGALLYRRHGRPGPHRQPAAGLRLLGNHRTVFVRFDRLP